MTQFIDTLVGIFQSSGFARFGEPGGYLYAIMICVGCFLLYLAIVKEFEPLILLPMAFGMILANLPGSGIIHMQYFVGDGLEHPMWIEILNNGGLADMLYMGVKLGIYPPLIFLGIGTMTDFAPLISNPKSLLLGAAAQFGIFGTYMGARVVWVATGYYCRTGVGAARHSRRCRGGTCARSALGLPAGCACAFCLRGSGAGCGCM